MARVGTAFLLLLLWLWPQAASAQLEASVSLLPVLSAGKTPVDKRLLNGIDTSLTQLYKKKPKYRIVEAGPILKKKKIKAVNILQEDAMKDTARLLGTDMILGLGVQQKKSNRPGMASYMFYVSMYDAKAEMWIIKTTLHRNHATYQDANKYLFDELGTLLKGPYPLVVETKPAGADVVMDGKKVGETPFKTLQASGKTTVTLMMAGRKQMDVSFTMPSDRPVHAAFTMKEDPQGVAFGAVAPVAALEPPPPAPKTEPEPAPVVAVAEPPKAEPVKAPPVVEPEPEQEPEPEPEVLASPEPEPEPTVTAAPEPDRPMSERRKWAWRSIGLGVGMALGGVASTLSSLYYDDQAGKNGLLPSRQEDYTQARDQAALSGYVLYGLAAAGITTGLVLYFTEPANGALSKADSTERPWSVQAGVLPGGGAVEARLSF